MGTPYIGHTTTSHRQAQAAPDVGTNSGASARNDAAACVAMVGAFGLLGFTPLALAFFPDAVAGAEAPGNACVTGKGGAADMAAPPGAQCPMPAL
eukprot:CAMPEP_0197926482 /NCGR_PEP_ID=MMETSP1439-20131203/99216_1 /TAXON_ID=66791 /ORGANISM="Gonyaulax spinifera, Strain CCMP409" /LENGTH=94 /DNA_ID=CAMNT_0043549021 /DNA_START=20 /DNA_END=300 /DNA_ORIENTATION=-